jgi:glutamate carboxypeptidase
VNPAEILAVFQACSELWIEELRQLVAFDTPSGDAERLRAFVRHYRRLLEAGGLECRELDGPAGPHLFAERGGEGPALVLVGHSDTVWPAGEVERRPPRLGEGRLWGPGVYDMKSGLCLIAAALGFVRQAGAPLRRRLEVFVSADEEVGGVTAHPHMDAVLERGNTAIVLEPPCPDGSLKLRRKGVGLYRVRVEGRESHAGAAPGRGVSAVSELVRLIAMLESWADPERGVQVNIGTVGGGTATNVVAGSAWCGIDLRFDRVEDGEEFERRLRALEPRHSEARLSVEGGLIFPPLEPTPESIALSRLAIRLAGELGLEFGAGSSGGGSDGSFLASRGLHVLDGLGLDGDGAHSLDEHVVVERFAPRAALLASLVLELDSFPPLY